MSKVIYIALCISSGTWSLPELSIQFSHWLKIALLKGTLSLCVRLLTVHFVRKLKIQVQEWN